MPRTKKEIVFLVIGLLVSPFAKGQCDGVKEEDADFIVFPKAFFSSDTDHVKRFLSGNSLIVRAASGGTQWHQWNNSYYAFGYSSNLTWEDAMERCRSFCEGAHLVFIASDQENREVSRLAVEVSGQQKAYWWIGLNDKDKENSWKWNDISVSYTNWKNGEPNGNRIENCGEFRGWKDGNAFWNDRKCSRKAYFICEKDVKSEL